MAKPTLKSIRKILTAHGQDHLLAFYDELEPPQQNALLEQLAAIDFDRLDKRIEQYVLNKPAVAIPDNIEPPAIEPIKPTDEETIRKHAEAAKHGREMIADGKVAVFVVAGGQGTRLGFEGPKGCFQVTPVTEKPLFQVFAEQILAASRRAKAAIPWYIMTSPANDVATRAFFRQHNFFGLNPRDVVFFVQGTMPAIGFDGKVLLADKGHLALSPDGHGGSLRALRTSSALDDMAKRGIELVSYFQVDNPLTHCVDPLFLGLHAMADAEMSAKALPKRDPMEKLGNFCVSDGRVIIIEYSDMPEELATACSNDGRLKFSYGSIALHVLSRSFVERLTADGDCSLPLHRAEKKVPFMDTDGTEVYPDAPNAVKLEMFVFDALPMAKNVVLLETLRDEEFSPVKNATGPDSPATCLHDQVRRAAAWLELAGVSVPRDADGQVTAAVEISPLYADSADELAAKVRKDLKITAGQNLYLGERGQTGGLK